MEWKKERVVIYLYDIKFIIISKGISSADESDIYCFEVFYNTCDIFTGLNSGIHVCDKYICL
jgi:hypothetical protein